jgi:uncharacterized protein
MTKIFTIKPPLALLLSIFFLFLISCKALSLTVDQTSSNTQMSEPYIDDNVGLLTNEQVNELSALLDRHNRTELGRLYLCIIEKLPDGKTIEQYTYEKINEKPKEPNERRDKILLLMAMENRQLRIETSRDVWPILTDEFCKEITSKVIVPKFKREQYYNGIKEGIMAMIEKLKETRPKNAA